MERDVKISYQGPDTPPGEFYARVTEGQYQKLIDRDNLSVPAEDLVMPLYAQLTPTGDVGSYVLRLSWVTDVRLWEAPDDSGVVREWGVL